MYWNIVVSTLLVFIIIGAKPSEATVFFISGEESIAADSALPSSSYSPQSGYSPRQDQGYARATSGNPKGSKVLEWGTAISNATDMFNAVNYQIQPSNGGTLYMGYFVKVIRVNGVQVWPDACGGNCEGTDKAIELVGTNYRWTMDFGIRSQNGPPGTWNIFVGNPNPGHFNRECEAYDSYYQNFSGYGRGLFESNVCQPTMGNPYYALQYDQWYAVVFKVTFEGTKSGEVGVWINGTKVMQYTNIQTCGVSGPSCAHDRFQLWGTYRQPSYTGPVHKRQLDAFVVTDDLSYLQSNGYFTAPSQTSADVVPPVAPSGLVVK